MVQNKFTNFSPDDKFEFDIYTICKIEIGLRRFDDKKTSQKTSKKHTIKNKDLSRVNILDIIVYRQFAKLETKANWRRFQNLLVMREKGSLSSSKFFSSSGSTFFCSMK
jgi:hypothetical protein